MLWLFQGYRVQLRTVTFAPRSGQQLLSFLPSRSRLVFSTRSKIFSGGDMLMHSNSPGNACESWRSVSYRFVCLNRYKRTYLNLSSRFRGSVNTAVWYAVAVNQWACNRHVFVDVRRIYGCHRPTSLVQKALPTSQRGCSVLSRLTWKTISSQFSSSIHRN